jgi:hypothetical protein
VEPAALRSADFERFFSRRKSALLSLIESVMGKPAVRDLAEATEAPAAFEPEQEDLDDVEEADEGVALDDVGASEWR